MHNAGFDCGFDRFRSILNLEHSADLAGFGVASNDFDVGLWEVLLWGVGCAPFHDVLVGHFDLLDGVGDSVLAHGVA